VKPQEGEKAWPTLLAAAKVALQILQSVQAENELNPDAMPWPEIDNLEQAIREADYILAKSTEKGSEK
jgi:hypothetical protein